MENTTDKPVFEQLPVMVDDVLKRLESLAEKIEPFLKNAQLERPMGVEDCAAFLSDIEGREVTAEAIYNRVHRRRIPYHKDGGRLYFYESEILEALRKGETKTLAQQTDEYFSQTA